MDATSVAVHCYWNGRVKKEKGDVDYEGENVNIMPFKLNHRTKYAELLDKIHTITGIDRSDFELNIICRYPISSREYKPIPIENDEAVELMLEVPIKSGVFCVEIYLGSNAVYGGNDGLFADEGDDGLFADEGDDGLFVDEGDDDLFTDEGDDGLFADEGNDDLFADEFLSKDGNGNRSVPRLLSYGIDSKMEGRKWEELNMECLVNVFQKVGMESLLLDVPLVCKSWHKASLDPKCWEHLIFPKHLEPDDDIWDIDSFAERLMMEDQENFAVTAFIKFVIDRSRGCATILRLPGGCAEEALEYAANECPRLKILRLNTDLLNQQARIIPKLIPKWKNLQVLVLGSRYKMEEILAQIAIHCNNFVRLSAPGIYVGNKDASAIVTSLPNLSYLVLKETTIQREGLVMILQGCKQLVHLDVKGCIGFDEDDAELLELASHIPSFMCEGSCLYDPYDYDDLSYENYGNDHYGCDYYFDPYDYDYLSNEDYGNDHYGCDYYFD